MLASTLSLLADAKRKGYALAGINVYNLEGIRAVIQAAEACRSPVLLQLHFPALIYGGPALLSACLSAGNNSRVPVGIHLDHMPGVEEIEKNIQPGISSVMADGSHLSLEENVRFTAHAADIAHARGAAIEGELGRISGIEDHGIVAEKEALYTDPAEAAKFAKRTGIDMLAVCIGNVHGRYCGKPRLDFDRLEAIHRAVPVPLVLHGASGLSREMMDMAIARGVHKFNINTDVRAAFIHAIRKTLARSPSMDLIPLMEEGIRSMQLIVEDKLNLLGSANQV